MSTAKRKKKVVKVPPLPPKVVGRGFRFHPLQPHTVDTKRFSLYPGPASDVAKNQLLGYIYWHVEWEKYCYDPGRDGIDGCVFDADDLQEIAAFIRKL